MVTTYIGLSHYAKTSQTDIKQADKSVCHRQQQSQVAKWHINAQMQQYICQLLSATVTDERNGVPLGTPLFYSHFYSHLFHLSSTGYTYD